MRVVPNPRPRINAPRLRAWLSRAGGVARAVLGVPDYERYLRDAVARDPLARPLSRDELAAERLRARYERPGSRCC